MVDLDAVQLAMDATGHPMRLRVLRLLGEHGRLSPKDLTELSGETLGTTAYHVRILLKRKLIKPSGPPRAVRGALQHFYVLSAAGERLLEQLEAS